MPDWPNDVPYHVYAGSWSMPEPVRQPIDSEFDGGNIRRRRRPGDNVATIQFQIVMTRAELGLFLAWLRSSVASGGIANGTARFTMPVWLGTSYVSKTVQFPPQFLPSAQEYGVYKQLSMKLLVYGV